MRTSSSSAQAHRHQASLYSKARRRVNCGPWLLVFSTLPVMLLARPTNKTICNNESVTAWGRLATQNVVSRAPVSTDISAMTIFACLSIFLLPLPGLPPPGWPLPEFCHFFTICFSPIKTINKTILCWTEKHILRKYIHYLLYSLKVYYLPNFQL